MNPESTRLVVTGNHTDTRLMIDESENKCCCLSEYGNARPDAVASPAREVVVRRATW